MDINTHEIRKTEFPDLKLRDLNDLFESWIFLKSPRGHELVCLFNQFYSYFQNYLHSMPT